MTASSAPSGSAVVCKTAGRIRVGGSDTRIMEMDS
jgi:hypothetical protein